jgi:DNA-binding SARP family transcriptional activator
MQREPLELAKIGPCGISCTICRFCIYGQCECRVGEGASPFDLLARHQCPVEQCATSRGITFCARDCPDFPCLLLERIIPYRWCRLSTGSACAPLPAQGSSHPMPLPPGKQQSTGRKDILHILCLGEFRVFRGDVELKDSDWGNGKGPAQKIKALLAFLMCQRAQGARKETLIDLLWPQQTDPKRASSSFHQALFYLRRALEPDLKPGAVSSYIDRRGERYFFAPQKPYWIDADAFVHYTGRAQALEQSGDTASAIDYWARAADLYGGRFMAGIDGKYTYSDYYDWCALAGLQFEQLFLTATMAVARHYLALGHHAVATGRAREALQVEPALESAHRLLMQSLIETGQLEQALHQYRVCEAELAFHQDHAPSAQTNLLYQRIVEVMRSA